MRLIDADALKSDHNMCDECDKCGTKWKECQYDYIYSKMDFCTWIDYAPTIDAVEVVHGEWIIYPISDGMNQCSKCGVLRFGESNYCPNCGAKMDGERSEEP